MNTKLITVHGRVLQGPRVKYKNDNMAQVFAGSWNMRNIQFNTAGSLNGNWSYLMVSYERGSAIPLDKLETVVDSFYQSLKRVGIPVPPPKRGLAIRIRHPNDGQLEKAFNEIVQSDGRPKLLLVILPQVDTVLYNRVKHIGDVKVGVHTICVVAEKFAKEAGQMQYFANVALKLNLKLGGINQLIDNNARLGIINEDKTMVIGIDVTHPSPGSAPNAPSVASMVASVDRWLGQWPAVLRVQEARKEMVSELGMMLESRLKLWRSQGKHAALPENLLIYRDGVSEGQYQLVLDKELPLLREVCKRMYPPADSGKGLPRISIVIVGKRHHTRFYPSNAADADSNSNPKAGTIVDRGITETRNWNFFLQAHTALKGTARPAHYYVVLDEIFSKRKVTPPFQHAADVLEDLTHNMCYLYGRATKVVSIATPAYYADIVCERARCYLSGLFDASPAPSEDGSEGPGQDALAIDVKIHEKLQNSMFYI